MGASFTISNHAAERYIERVEPGLSMAEARAAIRGYSKGIEAALEFGCKSIRLACGARLMLDIGHRVVTTVHPAQPKIHRRGYHGRRHPRRGSIALARKWSETWQIG